MRWLLGVAATVLALAGSGCGKKSTAGSVCERLVAEGIAQNCRPKSPQFLNLLAMERVDFDLRSNPKHHGEVLLFKDAHDLQLTSEGYRAAVLLTGPYRFESEGARIFVHVDGSATPDEGAKVRAIVERL